MIYDIRLTIFDMRIDLKVHLIVPVRCLCLSGVCACQVLHLTAYLCSDIFDFFEGEFENKESLCFLEEPDIGKKDYFVIIIRLVIIEPFSPMNSNI